MRQNNWQTTANSKPEMVNIPIISKPFSRIKKNLYPDSDSSTYKQNTTNQLKGVDIAGDNRHGGNAKTAKGQYGEQALVLQKTLAEIIKWHAATNCLLEAICVQPD